MRLENVLIILVIMAFIMLYVSGKKCSFPKQRRLKT